MPKIAILISGEYRKFDIARKTMPFLDDENVDIYVSTWDKTVFTSEKINLHVEEEVTEERILRDLGRSATIKIDRHDLIKNARYNTKMINRWIVGHKLIRNSGIQYDYVMIMRPDLYFHQPVRINLDNLEKYNNVIGFAWATSLHLSRLPDVIFLSSYKNITTLIANLMFSNWGSSRDTNWHSWWYTFVQKFFPDKIIDADEFTGITFCRYWTNENHTFMDAVNIHHDWRDLRLLHECDLWGDSHAKGIWPDEILINARAKWDAGYFDKYK